MRTPAQIRHWLDENMHRLDLPQQWLGDEPNSYRRPWEASRLRWCMLASWPYEQAAGNSSVPAVYKAINIARDDFLCDRAYLPATPRDLRMLERDGIGMFGIESRHPLRDFDVVATSISYPVLSMNFVKMLSMSGIPPRWRDRTAGDYPMVIAGGLSYGAPEILAPVVDCWWLGEVEDEPDNPGIGTLCARIAGLRHSGLWSSDREACYRLLAREFNHLYFPRFVDVHYADEDRGHVGVGPHPSKQVVAYTSTVDGMRMPFTKRIVHDLDKIVPLDDPPLLYADPAMGSGDLEVGRGCPAWCSFPLAGHEEFITRDGVQRLDQVVGRHFEVWTPKGWAKAEVEAHGPHTVQEIVFRPADQGTANRAWRAIPRTRFRRTVTATPCHGWELVDGTETHELKVGDIVPAARVIHGHDYDPVAFVHGFLFGDGHQRHAATGKRRPAGSGSFKVRLFGRKADTLPFFEDLPKLTGRSGWDFQDGISVTSIAYPGYADGDPVVHGWASFNVKTWPAPDATPEYMADFLLGWKAADASRRSPATSCLDAQYSAEHHGEITPTQWLARYAATAGQLLVGTSQLTGDTNFGPRAAPLARHTLGQAEGRGWMVESITPLPQPVPVYCLTVPGVRRFTLASGITTGNCSLTFRAKPYRQRSVASTVEYATSMQDNMGAVRMAPFSPDFPMHTERKNLVTALLEKVSDEVDAPTMRVDDFIADNRFILLQVGGGMDSVTLGVEGNSQRMRDLVGKGTSDEDIKEAVARGIRAGIRKFKLFMISSLPGEDEGDIMRILKLAHDLADIRESMNQPTVRIQFSWTPLICEGNTPMQWFAPTPPSRMLGDVWEEMRELKIDTKLGAKAEPNKIAFFQLAQRASRHVGEALVDAMAEVDLACYGGLPRTFADLIETHLRRHGFRNGYGDCFDERHRADMFGWEMIDQGINTDLMWQTYLQMREFVEQSDSQDYDSAFDERYHGNEWIARCDERCLGKSCGVCTYNDLSIRRRYLQAAANDRGGEPAALRPVNQRSQATRIRARLQRPERYRYVDNAHWRFAVRRAAFRAQRVLGWPDGIAKRTIRFASDETRSKDWTYGTDYVEFAFVAPTAADDIATFLDEMNHHLGGRITLSNWAVHPVKGTTLRTDVDTVLYEIPVDVEPAAARAALARWHAADTVPMQLAVDGGYFAPAKEQVNARDHVDDLWLHPDGHRLLLRMLVRGRPTPYDVYAALMQRPATVDTLATPARRLDVFVKTDAWQLDFLRPACRDCGRTIPVTVLDQPWHPDRCPRCLDQHQESA